MDDFLGRLGWSTGQAIGDGLPPLEDRIPHTELRQCLQADPAMNALLPSLPFYVSLGSNEGAPFRFSESGIILLPPALLHAPPAMALAYRWAVEVHPVMSGDFDAETSRFRCLQSSFFFAQRLMKFLPEASAQTFLSLLPHDVADSLRPDASAPKPSSFPLSWMMDEVMGLGESEAGSGKKRHIIPVDITLQLNEIPFSQFEQPLEAILVSGGDSRLSINPDTLLNRYGVCPRPRPEAIQFSSSTASAISEYGFLACELIRKHAKSALIRGEAADEQELRNDLLHFLAGELTQRLALSEGRADMIVAPSGTDAELISVMITLAGSRSKRISSILVAPEESGSGVKLAAGGRYFDELAATGTSITKEEAAFPEYDIEVQEVAIRDHQNQPRDIQDINQELIQRCEKALSQGRQVLLHVLQGSKTGLIAPDFETISYLLKTHPEQIDVVVDACQMRSGWIALGDLVKAGCMVQVSGSKFLTGPPFSGALMLPASLRKRAAGLRQLMQSAPAVSHPDDWPADYFKGDGIEVDERRYGYQQVSKNASAASIGPVFRWLPALIEAGLYEQLSDESKTKALIQFQQAILPAVLKSRYVRVLDKPLLSLNGMADLRWTIVAFEILVPKAGSDSARKALEPTETRRFFELLNQDLRGQTETPEITSSLIPCHVGQPVTLKQADKDISVLRIVLGARYFNTIGHARGNTAKAMLASQIADAKRIITKIEWLARNWKRFRV